MSRNTKRISCLLATAVLMGLICVSVWAIGVIVLGLPQANARLGPASPTLNPIYRTILSGYLLANENALDSPAGDPGVSVELEVLEGDTAGEVIERLIQAGVVTDGFLLRNYLRYRGFDVSVEAGHYQLHGDMTVRQIADALQTARPASTAITVVEGWRIEEIAETIESSDLNISSDEFLSVGQVIATDNDLQIDSLTAPSLEGFLFPDTYYFDPDSTASEVIVAMLENFLVKVDTDMINGFEAEGLSLFQAVTLASIVEREAVVPDEQPLIASVFLNRLASGMKLEADPTVQYALGRQQDGWWKAPLSLADLDFDSPYNTYMYPGLPPGPIANPGASALNAVAFPADTSYLYFRATCDGSGRHVFAETYEQHLQNACP